MLTKFHPVYHHYTYLAGSRVDVEDTLEEEIDYLEPDDLVDMFSEPPHFFERLSPVSTRIGEQPIKGRNWTDMMIKCYRMFGKIFTRSALVLKQTLEAHPQESHQVPFMSISVDPDTLVRLVERDYEAGETSYGKLMELFESGVISPAVTVPFHAILPLMRSSFDLRLCVRLGLLFYRPVLDAYRVYLRDELGEDQMVIGFWAPEACLNHESIGVIEEEFHKFCVKEKYPGAHLVLLMDADMAPEVPLDRLMKHWCQVRSPELDKPVSVIFRDRYFSEWMMTSHPSIKKIIDRTIAKVDVRLDEQDVEYTWGHFENLETLTYSATDAVHLEQRIRKLCELGYLALSPETFARRKLQNAYRCEQNEPVMVDLLDSRVESDPLGDGNYFGRWTGLGVSAEGDLSVLPNAPYEKKDGRKTRKIAGSPCWKVAWNIALQRAFDCVGGSPEKWTGGVLGLLARLTGQKTKKTIGRNVEAFLVEYGLIYWREHFLQHDFSEADLRLDDIVNRTLRRGVRKALSPKELAAAGTAARAYFFLLDSCNSYAMQAANMDQRALFQNAVMLTLAYVHGIAAFHYLGNTAKENEIAQDLYNELCDFGGAFERYGLSDFGIGEKEWRSTIKPEIPDSKLNVVERAARRTAARHLAEYGLEDLFPEEDEEISTNVGHNWTNEVNIPNYRWSNPLFCGVREA